jgi:hypothetical protein
MAWQSLLVLTLLFLCTVTSGAVVPREVVKGAEELLKW